MTERAFYQALKSKKDLRKYVKAGTECPPSWGETDRDILTTDEAIRYLILLIQERAEEEKEKNVVTTSLTTVATDSPESPTSIESNAKLLVEEGYRRVLEESPDVVGVYTVLNANDGKTSVHHQNWLCFRPKEKELLRFEPSREYDDFRTAELCHLIVKNLDKIGFKGVKYRIADEGLTINTFMGCRLMSTLLASMYVSKRPLEQARTLRGEPLTRPFAWLVQHSMKEELKCKKGKKMVLSRPSRQNVFPMVGS